MRSVNLYNNTIIIADTFEATCISDVIHAGDGSITRGKARPAYTHMYHVCIP